MALEMKLKNGGIDLQPLTWGPTEPILGHENEIDFEPIVLECTEVYLDDRAFFEHACSKDWMKAYAEIMQPAKSLKATTLCVGKPSDKVWQSTLDPFLNAININNQQPDLQPGAFYLEF